MWIFLLLFFCMDIYIVQCIDLDFRSMLYINIDISIIIVVRRCGLAGPYHMSRSTSSPRRQYRRAPSTCSDPGTPRFPSRCNQPHSSPNSDNSHGLLTLSLAVYFGRQCKLRLNVASSIWKKQFLLDETNNGRNY